MPVHVLILCTANICRSPMAAALLARQVAPCRERPVVSSAGFLEAGRGAPPEVLAAMDDVGIDLSGHRSTRVSTALLEQADVVIGMTRRHVRDASLLVPAHFDRMFTLRELVRLLEAPGPGASGASLADRLGRLSADRTRTDLVGRAPDDDVADPYGGPPEGYRATARELSSLTGRLAAAACGAAPGRGRTA